MRNSNNCTGSDDDNKCRAECHALANSVNPIGVCQAECPKGDGTAAENEFYKQCIIGCESTAAQAPATTPKPTGTDSTSKPTGGRLSTSHKIQVMY